MFSPYPFRDTWTGVGPILRGRAGVHGSTDAGRVAGGGLGNHPPANARASGERRRQSGTKRTIVVVCLCEGRRVSESALVENAEYIRLVDGILLYYRAIESEYNVDYSENIRLLLLWRDLLDSPTVEEKARADFLEDLQTSNPKPGSAWYQVTLSLERWLKSDKTPVST